MCFKVYSLISALAGIFIVFKYLFYRLCHQNKAVWHQANTLASQIRKCKIGKRNMLMPQRSATLRAFSLRNCCLAFLDEVTRLNQMLPHMMLAKNQTVSTMASRRVSVKDMVVSYWYERRLAELSHKRA